MDLRLFTDQTDRFIDQIYFFPKPKLEGKNLLAKVWIEKYREPRCHACGQPLPKPQVKWSIDFKEYSSPVVLKRELVDPLWMREAKFYFFLPLTGGK